MTTFRSCSIPALVAPACATLVVAASATAQTGWQRVPLLPHVSHAAAAFDTLRGELVVSGGEAYSGLQGETWTFDGVEWRRPAPGPAPAPRRDAAMAFDPARGVMVLFGGAAGSSVLGDTWEWNGATWAQRAPTHAPTARHGHAMAFDGSRQRVLLFGGLTASFAESDETWNWDGSDWARFAPQHRPPPRAGAAMAYDAQRDRVVLFGGSCFQLGPCWRMDTWEWNGVDWIDRTQPYPAPTPSPRWQHGMAFDAARGRIAVFGGSDEPNHYKDDCWEWDGAAWSERILPARPVGRLGHAFAFDAAAGRLLAFGGETWLGLASDTWALDASGWRRLHRGQQPPASPLPLSAAAYDARRDTIVWFGGYSPQQQTWEWNGERWWFVRDDRGPWSAEELQLAWLPTRGRTIAHSPVLYAIAESTWEYDGSTWTDLAPPHTPGVGRGFALALDPRFDRLVLFGGTDASGVRAATWWFDGSDWTPANPPIAPPARADHAMALDVPRGRVVLFGGNDGIALLGDTWEWDGSTWIPRIPTTAPAARHHHRMTFDHARRRTILYDHLAPGVATGETWEWDGVDWTLRATAQQPQDIAEVECVADVRRGGVVLHGPSAGTWRYAPVAPGAFTAFGSGCAPAGPVPAIAPVLEQRPFVGSTFELGLHGLPGPIAFAAFGCSNTTFFGVLPLPLDLGPFGQPGCSLLVQPDHVVALPLATGAGVWRIAIAANPALVGARFFVQAFGFDAAGRAAATRGGAGVLGAP